MRVRKSSIYKEFHCTGSACPVSCCKGWKIPLDDAVCEKFVEEQGWFGTLFRSAVKKEEGLASFRGVCGRCPFWGKDHLCRIQKKYGVEYMPQVCREFPRQLSNFGYFCEESLYLACPEAARIFLTYVKNGKPFVLEETEEEVTYEVNITNDDEDFLSYLLTAREQLIGMLGRGCRFDSMALLQYGKDAQDACLQGQRCPDPLQYEGAGEGNLKLDCAALNELFFNGFYHPYLAGNLPLLHRLCMKYILEFGIPGRINMETANRRLDALREDLYCKIPELDLLFKRYYEYYLQSKFLDIFEDYSFSRCLLYGMAKINMLWVLIALYAQGRKQITKNEIAKIIAVYERRASQMKKSLSKIMPDISKGIIMRSIMI